MDKEWINSLGASFAGSFGITSALVSGMEFKQWQFVGISISSAVLVSMVHLVALMNQRRKFRRFFGVESRSPVNIAIASYWNLREYQPELGEEENMRYFKTDGSSTVRRRLVGAIEYPLTDVGVASEAIQLASYIASSGSRKIHLFGDENIPQLIDGPVICLGSPTSNSETKRLLASLPERLSAAFTTKTLTCWLHTEPYASTAQRDFGLLLRITVRERVYFACAGIDEHGTMALSKLLLTKWKTLPPTDFIHIYRIQKSGPEVDEKLGG